MEAYRLLEDRLSRWCGTEAVVCSSGTAALHLALEALRLPAGSKVIVPDYTMVAVARAVVLAGLKPVFVDVSDYDMLLNTEKVAFFGGLSRVSAVVVPHLYGRAADMPAIHDAAGKYGLRVVEDLAEAHGVHPHPNSHAACWSFYRNKIVAGEEGGAVTFPRRGGATDGATERARSLRSIGFTDQHDYTHIPRGHNYRMANCLASAVLPSLAHIESNLAERREIEGWYSRECPEHWKTMRRDVVWVYDFRIRGMTYPLQNRIVGELRRAGIEARHGFKPMTSLEEWRAELRVKVNDKSYAPPEEVNRFAYDLSREVIYLPVRPGVTTEESAGFAFDLIKKVVREYGSGESVAG